MDNYLEINALKKDTVAYIILIVKTYFSVIPGTRNNQ